MKVLGETLWEEQKRISSISGISGMSSVSWSFMMLLSHGAMYVQCNVNDIEVQDVAVISVH